MAEIFERHLMAAVSADLTPKEGGCDVDLLTAAGIVAQRHALGMALYRMKFLHDSAQTEFCVRSLFKLTLNYIGRGNARSKSLAHRVAREVLIWWVDDRCTQCEGRKLMVIPDTARLSSKPCSACHGTGLKPLANEQLAARQFAAAEIELLVEAAQAAMRRQAR